MKVKAELFIQHGGTIYEPAVIEGIVWSTVRQRVGTLKFKVVKDAKLNFAEGDVVRLRINGKNVFYGFVFTKQRDKEKTISVTAYDQLRYLKNKDTYVYEDITATEIIKTIAAKFRLKTGIVEDTKYKIESLPQDNEELFQTIQNAIDTTLDNTGRMYVLYDDFGKITLKSLASMKVDLLIDEETGENFDYTSSIDSNTYNKIKLIYDNEKTGKREVFIAQDSKHINEWGILQYHDKLKKGENGKAKADALLKLYNNKTRNLTIKNAYGNVRVRAGSMIVVMLNLGDIIAKNWMIVEKCKHEFKESEHLMTLTVKGGEFNV